MIGIISTFISVPVSYKTRQANLSGRVQHTTYELPGPSEPAFINLIDMRESGARGRTMNLCVVMEKKGYLRNKEINEKQRNLSSLRL